MLKVSNFHKKFVKKVELQLLCGKNWQPAGHRGRVVDTGFIGWRQELEARKRRIESMPNVYPSVKAKLSRDVADSYAFTTEVCFTNGRPDLAAMFLRDGNTLIEVHGSEACKEQVARMRKLANLPALHVIPEFKTKVLQDIKQERSWVNGHDGGKAIEDHFLAWLQMLRKFQRAFKQKFLTTLGRKRLRMLAGSYAFVAVRCHIFGRSDLAKMFISHGQEIIRKYGSLCSKSTCQVLIELQAGSITA